MTPKQIRSAASRRAWVSRKRMAAARTTAPDPQLNSQQGADKLRHRDPTTTTEAMGAVTPVAPTPPPSLIPVSEDWRPASIDATPNDRHGSHFYFRSLSPSTKADNVLGGRRA